MVDSQRIVEFYDASSRAFICSSLGPVAGFIPHFAHGPPQAFELARLPGWPIVAQSQIIINAMHASNGPTTFVYIPLFRAVFPSCDISKVHSQEFDRVLGSRYRWSWVGNFR